MDDLRYIVDVLSCVIIDGTKVTAPAEALTELLTFVGGAGYYSDPTLRAWSQLTGRQAGTFCGTPQCHCARSSVGLIAGRQLASLPHALDVTAQVCVH